MRLFLDVSDGNSADVVEFILTMFQVLYRFVISVATGSITLPFDSVDKRSNILQNSQIKPFFHNKLNTSTIFANVS